MSVKEKRLSIRFTNNEYELIKDMSEDYRMKMSTMVRKSLLDDLDGFMSNKSKALNEEDREMVLKNINIMKNGISRVRKDNANLGRNINVIAKAINSDGLDIDTEELNKFEEYQNRTEELLLNYKKAVDKLWRTLT